MRNVDQFWSASVDELKKGYHSDKENGTYTCLICQKRYEDGIIYPFDGVLYSAKRAIERHIEENHGFMFEYFLEMGKVYTGLTKHQSEIMKMFYDGFTDKEIALKTNATNTSTIRNQRFVFNEKYKQAKIIVALTELLKEQKLRLKTHKELILDSNETLIDFHRTANMIDERYAITEAEKQEILGRYFDENNHLVIKEFPVKEQKKIIVLQHLMKEFKISQKYSENEVNEIIKRFYEDFSTIRRYLIQYGFLGRTKDGSEYWVKM